jgi:isopentenyldiphosphate isomerase
MSSFELIDVLDAAGNQTGEVLEKAEVHQRGLWHAGAHLIITDGRGNILQQHRDPSKLIMPNVWDIVSVAGHVSAGNTPTETLVVEADEELHLQLDPEGLRFLGKTVSDMTIEPGGWQHRVFDHNFATTQSVTLEDLQFQPGEVDDARWYPIERFAQDMQDPQLARQYANRPPDNAKLCALAITAVRGAAA